MPSLNVQAVYTEPLTDGLGIRHIRERPRADIRGHRGPSKLFLNVAQWRPSLPTESVVH